MDSKKPSTSSASKKRGPSAAPSSDEAEEAKRRKKESKPEPHERGGLTKSLHGNVYQLKLLMLYLIGAVTKKLQFRLETELTEAGKLDDLFFECENSETGIFLQAKHKQDSERTISLDDLLKQGDQSGNEFSLPKYFSSYRKIVNEEKFNSCKSKIFVICTNIDLKADLSKHFEDAQGDDILKSFSNKCKRFKFNDPSSKNIKNQLVSAIKTTSEFHQLATNLARCVLEKTDLDSKDKLFELYHVGLGMNVIERDVKDGKAKFRLKFIKNTLKSNTSIANFRKAFYNNYLELNRDKDSINEAGFWKKMKKEKLTLSTDFGIDSTLDLNPELKRSKELANAIVTRIQDAENNVVKIHKRTDVIKNNISKLAGYVFVKKGHDEKKYHINSVFLDLSYTELPKEISMFRFSLIEKLKENNKNLDYLNNYEFEIPSYNNKSYEDYFLPDDYFGEDEIEDFFSNLTIVVTLHETDLNEKIGNDLKKEFKLTNTKFQESAFLDYMLNWMKKNESQWLTHEKAKELIDNMAKDTSQLLVIGATLEYCRRIDDFGVKFKENTEQVENVLSSNDRHIFNLISPVDTLSGSSEVYRALQSIPVYQLDGSYIFTRLSSLSHKRETQKNLREAFTLETSLLIIECTSKNENNNIEELYKNSLSTIQQLHHTLINGDNKKIIFITLEGEPLPEEFKTPFSENNANMEDGNCNEEVHKNENDGKKYNLYSEEKSMNNSLAHLTENFQEELLNKKITFQGQEVELNTVLIDEVSKTLFKAEVLHKLINNKKIEIGKAPTDFKYDDAKDYFIDRTFIHHTNSEESFEELCTKYKQCNIHWLEDDGINFKSLQSRGNLNVSQKHNKRMDKKIKMIKIQPTKITGIPDRIVLISAEAGMGKSVILSHLSVMSITSPLWIIRKNLSTYSTTFNKWKEDTTFTMSLETALKFLYGITDFQLFENYTGTEDQKMKQKIIAQ
ncbi:uncharacterized protein LOC135850094 [Planococcus citri]|uniref:uncharacterized protein LOC135850094 n=1 Tax=Planococcus citri TaxID=170843 RepID=UPI0031FA153C